MDSIYWVVSRDCNQRCPHCYNDSGPGGPGLEPAEVDRCVANLPDPDDVPVGKVILSGGEVLAWPDLLFRTLDALRGRFGDRTELWVQTNGDLLDDPTLDRLILHGVRRVDISSMDRFHPKATLERRDDLTALFRSRGMVAADSDDPQDGRVSFGFWGATEDQWIGPLWPRGRARQKGLSAAGPEHEFCRMWSGARGFLDYRHPGCEISLQLADVYPCCPMTCRPIGCLLDEPLLDILDRCSGHPVFRALNEGRPEAMGELLGIDEAEGFRRSRELGNHCLWCDEFFSIHAPELLVQGARTERGRVDLDVDLSSLRVRRTAPSEAPGLVGTRPIDLGA
jgi:hypothetical protein